MGRVRCVKMVPAGLLPAAAAAGTALAGRYALAAARFAAARHLAALGVGLATARHFAALGIGFTTARQFALGCSLIGHVLGNRHLGMMHCLGQCGTLLIRTVVAPILRLKVLAVGRVDIVEGGYLIREVVVGKPIVLLTTGEQGHQGSK